MRSDQDGDHDGEQAAAGDNGDIAAAEAEVVELTLRMIVLLGMVCFDGMVVNK